MCKLTVDDVRKPSMSIKRLVNYRGEKKEFLIKWDYSTGRCVTTYQVTAVVNNVNIFFEYDDTKLNEAITHYNSIPVHPLPV